MLAVLRTCPAAVTGAVRTPCRCRAPKVTGRVRTPSRRSCPTSTTSNGTPVCGSATSPSATSTKIERQGWHALLTMQLNGDVEPARQRHRDGRPDQPARVAARRTGAADRRPARGQAARRIADPAVVAGTFYPVTEQTLAAVSLLLNGGGIGADPGDHQGIQHRLRRSRRRPEKPHRATGQVRRLPQRPDRRHHRAPPTA